MKMNKLFFGLLLQAAFYSGSLYAQADLRTNAYSIIQDAVTDIVCSSSTDAIQKEKRVIQVLNEKGKEDASFVCLCDRFSSLKKFSGEVRDASGNERNGGSQYFNAETGELSNQKEYRFDKNGGTGSSADSTNTNVTVNGDKNAFYGTTDKDIELVDGYFTANTWYRPKEILKDGKEWTASTENDKRPLLTVWWPSKAIQASYLNYMKEQGLGTNQTYVMEEKK